MLPPAPGLRRLPVLVAAVLLTLVVPPAGATGAPASPSPEPSTASPEAHERVHLVVLRRREETSPSQVQRRVLAAVGTPLVLYSYRHAVGGFAARLSPEQARRLRSHPEVELVERSVLLRPDSVDSGDAVGLRRAWRDVGGPQEAGAGTLVGVVDSGIWPEAPSFAGRPLGLGRAAPPGAEACRPAERWGEADCNSKVVAARWFVTGFGRHHVSAGDHLSPRDSTGHGTAVAGVAAGNHDVEVVVGGRRLGRVSGMAPSARLAVYKACWTAPDPDDDGCATADVVAAVDAAVADGVDVLALPLSDPHGDRSAVLPLALEGAARSGMFVAASAGNGGPRPGSVRNASPWVTTVAASAVHAFTGEVRLGDGTHLTGAMMSTRTVRTAALVDSERARAVGATAADARLCRPGSLDPSRVAGAIVVCRRGVVPRVDKSATVRQAGGVGMVLVNVRPDSTDPDFHAVPTVHLDATAGQDLLRHLAVTDRPTVTLRPDRARRAAAPGVAAFSGRGPTVPDGGSTLEPDLTAPGVGIVAPTAPAAADGRSWDQHSGTSLAAAHVAGLAALLSARHPGWSPSAVRSAMMTTADRPVGGVAPGPGAVGAGHLDAAAMLDPGLVLETGPRAHREWRTGTIPAAALNLPSVQVGRLVGRTRVVRRVSNVSDRPETYRARVVGLTGLDTDVRPAVLRLQPGESRRLVVGLRRTDAPVGVVARGRLLLSGERHRVTLPLTMVPRRVAAPDHAYGSGSEGRVTFLARAGAGGPQRMRVSGLAGAEPRAVVLRPGRFDPATSEADEDTTHVPLEVPRRTAVLAVELEGRDRDDVDLHLLRSGRIVAAATGTGGDATITLTDPAPGFYDLYVSASAAENGVMTTSQLYTWVVPRHAVGNLVVGTPPRVEAGRDFRVPLAWRGVDTTRRWLGVLHYDGSDDVTLVHVG